MDHKKRKPASWPAERICLIALTAGAAAGCIAALYHTTDSRHNVYGGLHIAAAINRHNTDHPADSIRSLEDAAALYAALGGEKALGFSYQRFVESLTNVTLEIKGQNMIVAYAPDFSGRLLESGT